MQINDTKKFNFFLQTKIFFTKNLFLSKILHAHFYAFVVFLVTLPRSFHTMPEISYIIDVDFFNYWKNGAEIFKNLCLFVFLIYTQRKCFFFVIWSTTCRNWRLCFETFIDC